MSTEVIIKLISRCESARGLSMDQVLSPQEISQIKKNPSGFLIQSAKGYASNAFKHIFERYGSRLTNNELFDVIDVMDDHQQCSEIVVEKFLQKCGQYQKKLMRDEGKEHEDSSELEALKTEALKLFEKKINVIVEAVRQNKPKVLELILQKLNFTKNINGTDSRGLCASHYAVCGGYQECVDVLLNYEVNPYVLQSKLEDLSRFEPSMRKEEKYRETMKLLESKQIAWLLDQCGKYDSEGVKQLNIKRIEGIEGLRIEVKAQIKQGELMLKKAIQSGSVKAVQFVVEQVGYKVYHCDEEGKTAYDYTHDLNDADIRHFLMNKGLRLSDNCESDNSESDSKVDEISESETDYELSFSSQDGINLKILMGELYKGVINESMYIAQVKLNGLDSRQAVLNFIAVKSMLSANSAGIVKGWTTHLGESDVVYDPYSSLLSLPSQIARLHKHLNADSMGFPFSFFQCKSSANNDDLSCHVRNCVAEISQEMSHRVCEFKKQYGACQKDIKNSDDIFKLLSGECVPEMSEEASRRIGEFGKQYSAYLQDIKSLDLIFKFLSDEYVNELENDRYTGDDMQINPNTLEV